MLDWCSTGARCRLRWKSIASRLVSSLTFPRCLISTRAAQQQRYGSSGLCTLATTLALLCCTGAAGERIDDFPPRGACLLTLSLLNRCRALACNSVLFLHQIGPSRTSYKSVSLSFALRIHSLPIPLHPIPFHSLPPRFPLYLSRSLCYSPTYKIPEHCGVKA